MIQEKKRRGRPPKESMKPSDKKQDATSHCRFPTKRVFICSPLKGNIDKNMANAETYCRFAFDKGYVPIAPHIYYPRFLNDNDKNERKAGLRYGMEEMWRCKQLWCFGEKITEGMRAEIELAMQLQIPVKYYDEDMEAI